MMKQLFQRHSLTVAWKKCACIIFLVMGMKRFKWKELSLNLQASEHFIKAWPAFVVWFYQQCCFITEMVKIKYTCKHITTLANKHFNIWWYRTFLFKTYKYIVTLTIQSFWVRKDHLLKVNCKNDWLCSWWPLCCPLLIAVVCLCILVWTEEVG